MGQEKAESCNNHILTSMTKLQTLITPSAVRDVEKHELPPLQAGTKMVLCKPLWKTVWQSLKRLFPYDPEIVLRGNLGQHKNLPRDVYSCFVYNCQTLEDTKVFFKGEEANNIQAMGYFSGLKSNELSSHEKKTWRDLKSVLLSEIR
jgi:hypothetical protein